MEPSPARPGSMPTFSARRDWPNIAGSRPRRGRSCRRERPRPRRAEGDYDGSRTFSIASPSATATSRRGLTCAPRTCRRPGNICSLPSSASSTRAWTRRCAGRRRVVDVRGRCFGRAARDLRRRSSHQGRIAAARPKPFSSALSSAGPTSMSICAGARQTARPACPSARAGRAQRGRENRPLFRPSRRSRGQNPDVREAVRHGLDDDAQASRLTDHEGRPRAGKRGGPPREALKVYAGASRSSRMRAGIAHMARRPASSLAWAAYAKRRTGGLCRQPQGALRPQAQFREIAGLRPIRGNRRRMSAPRASWSSAT